MKEPIQAQPGEVVSQATLCTEDLVEAFEQFLLDHNVQLPELVYEDEALHIPDWYLEDLFDLMSDLAPPNHYFGSHPGDGALFGYWPAEDFLD